MNRPSRTKLKVRIPAIHGVSFHPRELPDPQFCGSPVIAPVRYSDIRRGASRLTKLDDPTHKKRGRPEPPPAVARQVTAAECASGQSSHSASVAMCKSEGYGSPAGGPASRNERQRRSIRQVRPAGAGSAYSSGPATNCRVIWPDRVLDPLAGRHSKELHERRKLRQPTHVPSSAATGSSRKG